MSALPSAVAADRVKNVLSSGVGAVTTSALHRERPG
jgi:hypothetical protein